MKDLTNNKSQGEKMTERSDEVQGKSALVSKFTFLSIQNLNLTLYCFFIQLIVSDDESYSDLCRSGNFWI